MFEGDSDELQNNVDVMIKRGFSQDLANEGKPEGLFFKLNASFFSVKIFQAFVGSNAPNKIIEHCLE